MELGPKYDFSVFVIFAYLTLFFDVSKSNMQRGNRQTVEKHFVLCLKEIGPFCVRDPRTEPTKDEQTHVSKNSSRPPVLTSV